MKSLFEVKKDLTLPSMRQSYVSTKEGVCYYYTYLRATTLCRNEYDKVGTAIYVGKDTCMDTFLIFVKLRNIIR